jgi:competence protein ComEA
MDRVRYDGGMLALAQTMAMGGAALVIGVAFGVASPQAPQPNDSPLPDGPGKSALLKVCSDCHGPEAAVGQLKTREEWSKTLDEMAGNGAQGTDEEWNAILAYLDRHFSLIFVNKADAGELARTLDVADADGQAIVRYRNDHGRFETIDDLKKVPGLDRAKVDARKDRFVF